MTMSIEEPSAPVRLAVGTGGTPDRRWSWIPTGRMIGARWHELRRRRGLMALLAGVTVGIPALFLAIRLILHAVAPADYGPAGGYDVFVGLVAGILYLFGFIVAATLGATAGSVDLTEGMFRHHVITGRSRIALYLARIPAGLGIIVPLVAVGFAVVCTVSVLAAPRTLTYDGVTVPVQLSKAGFEQWAGNHASEVVDNLPLRVSPGVLPNVACLPGRPLVAPGGPGQSPCTPSQLRDLAVQSASQDYAGYARTFLSPSVSLMVETGLWIELEAAVAFLVGLGLGSLLGQRTVAVVLMIVLEIIITPLALRSRLPHLVNLQRSIVGVATARLEPSQLLSPFGGNGPVGPSFGVSEPTAVAICVVVVWTVAWTAIGAWRMATRDA